MGRWSRHPMGSDGALDARDGFTEDLDVHNGEDVIYFFERPDAKEALLSLSLNQIKEMAERYNYVSKNKFAIPYTYIEFGAYPTDPEIKNYLKECLDSHDDLTGPYNYCNGEEMKHLNFFKDNFEEIISGKMPLASDAGLFAAMEEATNGLINKTRDN